MVASLTSLLSFERVTATAVHRGVHALAAIKSVRPDLAIVDIGLPDYDGREICRAIVEQFSIPVVLTSGSFSQIERSNDGPFVHFLQKPFSMSDLRAAIAPLGFEIREQRKRRRRRVATAVVT